MSEALIQDLLDKAVHLSLELSNGHTGCKRVEFARDYAAGIKAGLEQLADSLGFDKEPLPILPGELEALRLVRDNAAVLSKYARAYGKYHVEKFYGGDGSTNGGIKMLFGHCDDVDASVRAASSAREAK